MEHTKKMILIDPRKLESIPLGGRGENRPPISEITTESLREMDQQMRDILNQTDMNLNEKANLYQQTLWRFLKRFDQYKDGPQGLLNFKPRKTLDPPPPPPPPPPVAAKPERETTEVGTVEQDVLLSVPKTMKKRAERLLQRVKADPKFKWNSRGEIQYRGQRIKKSNLTDLVNHVLRKRRTFAKPVGWKTFAQALRHLNVPQELIGNPDWRKFIRGLPSTSTSTATTSASSSRSISPTPME